MVLVSVNSLRTSLLRLALVHVFLLPQDFLPILLLSHTLIGHFLADLAGLAAKAGLADLPGLAGLAGLADQADLADLAG